MPANYPTPYRALPNADQFQHERDRGQQERGGGGVHVAVPPTRQAAPMDPVQLYPFQPSNFANVLSFPPTEFANERWEDFARRLYCLLNLNANPQDDDVIADWYDWEARTQYMETFRHSPYPDYYLRLGELLRRQAQMRMKCGHREVHRCVEDLGRYCARHRTVHGLQCGGQAGILDGTVQDVQRGGQFGILRGEEYRVVYEEEYDV